MIWKVQNTYTMKARMKTSLDYRAYRACAELHKKGNLRKKLMILAVPLKLLAMIISLRWCQTELKGALEPIAPTLQRSVVLRCIRLLRKAKARYLDRSTKISCEVRLIPLSIMLNCSNEVQTLQIPCISSPIHQSHKMPLPRKWRLTPLEYPESTSSSVYFKPHRYRSQSFATPHGREFRWRFEPCPGSSYSATSRPAVSGA